MFIENNIIEGSNQEGIINNVKILGFKSKNKRIYTLNAMKNALPLYEGKEVYVDHHTKRNVKDRFGRLRNVRLASDGIRGDLEYLTTHPVVEMVLEDLSRKTNMFGLSHVADGKWTRNKEGYQVVDVIESVDEVDLVSNPATTTNLVEQEAKEETPNISKLVEVTESQAKTISELTEKVNSLQLEIESLKKPKKYIVNKTAVVEQTCIPTDMNELRTWFYKG